MTQPKATILYVTCPSAEVGQQIAQTLVKQRLAACVHLLPSGLSIYEWQGTLEQTSEMGMLIKTTQAKADTAMQAIVAQHPYDCPCVLQLPVEGGHGPFLQWLDSQTA